MKYLKNLSKAIAFMFVFGLGYGFGKTPFPNSFLQTKVYVYDSREKIEMYMNTLHKKITDAYAKRGLAIDDLKVAKQIEQSMAKEREQPPLVTAGPITMFYNPVNGDYLLDDHNRPIANLETIEYNETELTLCSKFNLVFLLHAVLCGGDRNLPNNNFSTLPLFWRYKK